LAVGATHASPLLKERLESDPRCATLQSVHHGSGSLGCLVPQAVGKDRSQQESQRDSNAQPDPKPSILPILHDKSPKLAFTVGI
jgi:hypothetical protein